jgi:cysteine desulfurase
LHVDGKTIDKINLRLDMAGVAVSNGSACSSGVPKPSRVLVAMGLDEVAAANSLRISLGEKTTSEEIQYFIKCFSESIN